MAATPARPFASRVRNAITFVAIVWGVAATFVAFEVVSLMTTLTNGMTTYLAGQH